MFSQETLKRIIIFDVMVPIIEKLDKKNTQKSQNKRKIMENVTGKMNERRDLFEQQLEGKF